MGFAGTVLVLFGTVKSATNPWKCYRGARFGGRVALETDSCDVQVARSGEMGFRMLKKKLSVWH